MKKTKYIVVTILLLISFTACTKNDQVNLEKDIRKSSQIVSGKQEDFSRNEHNKNEVLNDKTVSVIKSVNLEGKNILEESTAYCDYAISSDLSALSDYASEIIQGSVKEVTYVTVEGDAWIKADIVVKKVLQGGLAINDVVSVYIMGGYVPLREHINKYNDAKKIGLSEAEIKNTVLKSTIDNEEFPVVGHESIFYLIQTPSESPLPNGVYERVCGKYSELKLNKNSNLFERDATNGNEADKEKFTIKNVEQKIENRGNKGYKGNKEK